MCIRDRAIGKGQRPVMASHGGPFFARLPHLPGTGRRAGKSVSYTHLDVYKRQIQDPALLTAISYDQDPEALRAFMVGDLGLDEASVDAAIEARQVYAEKQAESQAFDTFSAYLKEQDPTPVSYTHLDVYKRQSW